MKTLPFFSASYAASAPVWVAKRTFTKSSPGIPEYGGLWQWITSPNCAIALETPTRLCWGMMPVVMRTRADMAPTPEPTLVWTPRRTSGGS